MATAESLSMSCVVLIGTSAILRIGILSFEILRASLISGGQRLRGESQRSSSRRNLRLLRPGCQAAPRRRFGGKRTPVCNRAFVVVGCHHV
jgi:hypothetical protein